MILAREFYHGKDTLEITQQLLGKILVHESPSGLTSGRIVEVEAYCGNPQDPACHASKGKTKRNEMMFGPPGNAYVYFSYGMHHCFNVVVQEQGIADAILIRALEPLEGLVLMQRRRGVADKKMLCSGPGRLCQALDITINHNGVDLTKPPLYLIDDSYSPESIESSPRIGISQARELPWRFFVTGSQYVSRG